MTPRTCFVTSDWTHDPATNDLVPSGVSFYRCVMPMSVIPDAMIGRPRFSIGEGIGIDDGGVGVFGFEVAVIKLAKHKSMLKWIELGKKLGQRIVVDIDDFFAGLHHTNSAYEMTDPAKNRAENRDWMEAIALAADTITVSTPFLKDHYAALHPDVRMVRNSILPSMFTRRKQQHRPIIGWMGAVAWRSEDLETLSGWMPKFIADNHLQFHHSGHVQGFPYAHELIGIPRAGTSVMGMVPMNRLKKLFVYDLGVVPLNNIPFNHSKSFIKGIEQAAAGIPYVASDLPEYRLLADEGVGYVAGSDEEWTEIMGSLLGKKARMEAAERALSVVLERHTIASRAEEWRSAITVPKLMEVLA